MEEGEMLRSLSRGMRGGKVVARATMVLTLIGGAFAVPLPASAETGALPRPTGPCDIYAAAGTPCVAAHSTTRALYASYDGPLYQVKRQSDRAVDDIGVVAPTASEAGG